MKYREIDGDLIKLATEGEFDLIAHGCNCQCVMGAGIAPKMDAVFGCGGYPSEVGESKRGDVRKLGNIEWGVSFVKNGSMPRVYYYPTERPDLEEAGFKKLIVVNAYTQFDTTGRRRGEIDLNYAALELCLEKINHIFKGKHIGLPKIGCGLAGGDWFTVSQIIRTKMTDCQVTIVNFNQ